MNQPSDDDRRRLEWVQKNRARKDRTSTVGESITKVVGVVMGSPGLSMASQASTVIAAVVDDEFRHHCRVAVSDRGLVTILVDGAVPLDLIRRRWEEKLRTALQSARVGCRTDHIRFGMGLEGLTLAGLE